MISESPKYRIQRISDFSSAIVAFINRYVNEKANQQRLNWEYQIDRRALLFLTLQDEEDNIKGSQALIPILGCYKGQIIETGKSECTYVDQDFRGSQAFGDLYNSFLQLSEKEAYSLIWGLTSAVKIWKEKLNFEVADMIIFHFDLHNSRGLANLNQLPRWKREMIKLKARFQLKKFDTGGWTAEACDTLSSEDVEWKASILQQLGTPFYIGTSAQYYQWRVTDNPYIKYSVWRLMKEGVRGGYLITSQSKGRLWIHEWIFSNELDAAQQFNLIRKKIARYDERIGYVGNRSHPINKSIENIFISNNGTFSQSDWAGLVVKSNDPKINATDLKDGLINLLWTEGV
jgi:hypothetical protein